MKNVKKLLKSNLLKLCLYLININYILTQNTTLATSITLEYDGILGIGWGVFIIICAIFLGIIICILGFSTTYQITFYIIGFAVPVLIFLIMVFTPVQMNEEIDLSENQEKNHFAIVRYLIMGLVALALITLMVPYMKINTIVLIPQRVDSRSQREYLEKFKDIFSDKIDSNTLNKQDGNDKNYGTVVSNQPQILSISNYNDNQIYNQDIEMANINSNVNKERKRKLKSLKRKRNDEDDLI